jgi:hypothetical protein
MCCGRGNGKSKLATSPQNLKYVTQSGTSIPAVHIHLSRRMLIMLAIVLLSPCMIVAVALCYPHVYRSTNTNKALPTSYDEKKSAQINEGKLGPWGQLLYANVMIDIPDEFVMIPPNDQPSIRWFFQDYTRDSVIELLRTAGISQAQIDKDFPDSAWELLANSVTLTPGDEFILKLSAEARSKIYGVLIAYSENFDQMDPVWFRPETLDKQLSESELSQSSIKLLKSLLYRNSSSLLIFADRDVALRQLPNDNEKRLFIKAISRKATLFARLKIDADTDVDSLANYWGVGGRRKDILPLMNSLQHVEGGLNMSIIYLMPNFIRGHLYNYPFPSSDPQATKQDCFWSAFNAFNSQTDDRFSDMQFARQTLIKDYYSISQPSQLGDLVFLADSNNEAMHVAVYVADDIVFTKNGFHCTQPWILMHLKDMVETYAVHLPPGKQLNVLYLRKKNL